MCRASCCIYASMAKTARMKPPKESVLTDAELVSWGASVAEAAGLLSLPLEVGEPVETVPLLAVLPPLPVPVGTETVVLPPVGRGTTAVVPSGAVTAPVVGTASVAVAVSEPAGTEGTSDVPAGAVVVPSAGAVAVGAGTRGVAGGACGTLATARCILRVAF